MKKQAKRRTDPLDFTHTDSAQSPEEAFLSREREQAVYQALYSLSPQYRDVIYLLYVEGFTREEVGRILHRSRRQMENLCYRARQALRAALPEDISLKLMQRGNSDEDK